MKCAWFLISTFLFGACFIHASEKKCDEVKFGHGVYYKKHQCWKTAPTKPRLGVGNRDQSLSVRRKILRALKCRPGIKKFLDQTSCDCEPSKLSSIGLKNICPHKFHYVTEIHRQRRRCYVVFPQRQCVTYADCKYEKYCSKSRGVKSACLPDRHRYFNVWVFCPNTHRFELETLELPQCCTCREYKLCRRPVEKETKVTEKKP